MNMYCLGADGQMYYIRESCELEFDERGLPCGYERLSFPSVKIVAAANDYDAERLESHPVRKAYFKLSAAIQHQIREKMRPQDVTYDEAKQMLVDALRGAGLTEDEVAQTIERYVPKMPELEV